jgi:hypothetical protein
VIDTNKVNNFLEEIFMEKNTYEVWAVGYNESGKVDGSEMLINKFNSKDRAIECTKNLCLADIVDQASKEDDGSEPSEDIFYISLEVENSDNNIIYKRDLWIDGEYGSEEDIKEFFKEEF